MMRWISMERIVALRASNPPYAAALEHAGVRQGDRLVIDSASLRKAVAWRQVRPPEPPDKTAQPLDREAAKALCAACPELEDDTCTSRACGMCARSPLRTRPWESLPRCPQGEWGNPYRQQIKKTQNAENG